MADKNFIVGFLLPVLAAAVALLFLLSDLSPFADVYTNVLKDMKPGDVTLTVGAIWAVAVLLMLANNSLYRVLEGYVGPFAWLKYKKRKAEAAVKAELDALEALYEKAGAQQGLPGKPSPEKLAYVERLRDFRAAFPSEPDLVLPTRFGNVIRAFETYPLDAYGVDAIPAWLRLQGAMPKGFQGLVADARAQVDFFVNAWTLALIVAAAGLLRAALNVYGIWHGGAGAPSFDPAYPVVAALALAIACLAYRAAIPSAAAWGDMVKSGFDLYLPALAKQLGYRLPDTPDRRRLFWDAVNGLFLYSHPMNPDDWPRDAASPAPPVAVDADAVAGDDDDGANGD